jgi:predicted small lipoprotein YifL
LETKTMKKFFALMVVFAALFAVGCAEKNGGTAPPADEQAAPADDATEAPAEDAAQPAP